jgi:hypothetical protein
MKKIVLTFGLISGVIVSSMMIVTLPFEQSLEGSAGVLLGYATMVAAFLLIYFGIRSYRDNIGAGRLSFGRAMAIGSLIAVISSLCYTATWEVMYFGSHSQFAEKYSAHAIERAKANGASQAEIAKVTQDMQAFTKNYHNPLYNSAMTIMEPLPVGLIIALVSAGILSRRKRNGGLATLPA